MLCRFLVSAAALCTVAADPSFKLVENTHEERLLSLQEKWGYNWAFSGISTFGHLPHVRCLTDPDHLFDIGIIGVPFDTTVSYRPGARLGPRAIRSASTRHLFGRGFNTHASVNPYATWATITDCGDVPVTPFDNAVAFDQMTQAFIELGNRIAADPTEGVPDRGPTDRKPRLIALGGDHSIALPALRALRRIHGQPIALLHFDAHLDTLKPDTYPSAWSSPQSEFNHGTVFWQASQEGLLSNISSVHAGINTRLSGVTTDDYNEDDRLGFLRIYADELDDFGIQSIIDRINQKIGNDVPVYLSIDIDVLDPAFAPGTGAPEPGGWTTREMLKILRGLGKLNIVGADVVEVAPAYDTPGGDTAFVAANLVYEILTNMVKYKEVRYGNMGNEVAVEVGLTSQEL